MVNQQFYCSKATWMRMAEIMIVKNVPFAVQCTWLLSAFGELYLIFQTFAGALCVSIAALHTFSSLSNQMFPFLVA